MQAYIQRLLTKIAKRGYEQDFGLTETASVITWIYPAADLILSRPADAAHSEYNGMAKVAQQLLIDSILSSSARLEYGSLLRTFPFPPTWARLQSVLHHLGAALPTIG